MQAISGARRRAHLSRSRLWRSWRMPGRSCFQYFPYRLSGNFHRSLLCRPNRGAHQPADRQLRHQPGGQRVGPALYRGPDRPRVLAHQLQLALRAGHRRVHGALFGSGAGRDRHPRPGPPSAHLRRNARRDFDCREQYRLLVPRPAPFARWTAPIWRAWSRPSRSIRSTRTTAATRRAILSWPRLSSKRRSAEAPSCSGL